MFFLKKKYFDKFKERYGTIRVHFIRPDDLDDIPNHKGFHIKIKKDGTQTTYYYKNSISNSYSLRTPTNKPIFIDRPLTFGKLVDLLKTATSNAGTGFLVRLSLTKSDNQNAETVGYIKFSITNNNGNIYLSSITYEDSERQEFKCDMYIDENSNTSNVPNIFFGKNMNPIGVMQYTGDIANILITEDYFNNTKTIQLAIANLDVVVGDKITN